MEEVINQSVETEPVETTEEVEAPQEKSVDEIREQIQKVKAGEYDVDDQPPKEESELETDNEEVSKEEQESAPELSDDTEITVGEDAVTLKELRDGYLRQSDYTKKTQTLATERKEFESLQEEVKPVKEWLDWWSANPYLREQITNALNEWENSGVLPIEEVIQNSDSGKYINHLLSENQRLKQELDKTSTEYQSTKFESDMRNLESDLKGEYGDLVDDEFLSAIKEQAQKEKLSVDVLKRIAKGELADKKLAKVNEENEKKQKQIEAETIKNIQKNTSTSAGALGQEEGTEQAGFSQMSKKQQREFIEKVKRGEIKNL